MSSKQDKKDKPMNNFSFRSMSLLFKFRDIFLDPIKKVKKAEVTKGNIVLDYGSGPGSFSIAAGKIVGTSGKVYAADIQPLSAKKVVKKAQKNKLDNIIPIITNCKTNLPANSVDVIICFDMFHMLNEPNKILAEFHRVLKPTGILSIDCHHLKNFDARVTNMGYFSLRDKLSEKSYNFIKS